MQKRATEPQPHSFQTKTPTSEQGLTYPAQFCPIFVGLLFLRLNGNPGFQCGLS